MKNTERLLAQKALHGKMRRKESKQSLLQINREQRRYEEVVHKRKEAVANQLKGSIPSVSRLNSKKPAVGGKKGLVGGVLVGDVDILRRVDSLNNNMLDRSRKVTNVIDRPRTTQGRRGGGLMCNRKESERSVLKLAYSVRAKANQRPEIQNYDVDSATMGVSYSNSNNSLVRSFGGGRYMGGTGVFEDGRGGGF